MNPHLSPEMAFFAKIIKLAIKDGDTGYLLCPFVIDVMIELGIPEKVWRKRVAEINSIRYDLRQRNARD